MSDNASPRPWHTANFINGIEDANNGKVAADLRDEDADFIVKAVNLHEWLVEHNKLNAEKVCELIAECDKLRETVREVVRTCEHALGYTNAPGGQAAFCQVAPSDLRHILSICLGEPGGAGLAPAASAAGKEGV